MRPSLVRLGGRSAWKGALTAKKSPVCFLIPTAGPYFVAFPNLREARENGEAIKTQARSCTILPNFVGLKFEIHNGKHYIPLMVTDKMVGHKLGEFAPTRKPFSYKCVARNVLEAIC
ncbi:ribosomal protein S19/S15 [Calocera cornea HHB12733]|uniref:Ribosomal protein S19/S15 n=1 Tax=Calocera cornea HHB12733 TaxID=1353952 RepID=A0A165FRT9_9BASI|nr:ribosomal protein S19/S15 [Calocera cornea HHB12733]